MVFGRLIATICLVLLPLASPASDEQLLYDFLHDLVKVSLVPENQQAVAIREALARNPQPLVWLLEGRDVFAMAHIGGIPLVSETRIEQHLAAFRNNEQLADYLSQRLKEIQGSAYFQSIQSNLGKTIKFMSNEQRFYLLSEIPDGPFFHAAKAIEQAIADIEITRLGNVDILNSDAAFAVRPEGSVDAEIVNQIAQLRNLFVRYFEQLSVQQRAPILMAILKLPPQATQTDRLLAVLQNSGIVMQKLFQAIGQRIESEGLREAARKLLETVQPFSSAEAKSIIEAELGRPLNEIFRWFGDAPLKAATTGQIHLAMLKSDSSFVVIKVLRPGARYKAEQELKLIQRITKGTILENAVTEAGDSILKELDYRNESAALKEGVIYNDAKRGLKTVEIVDQMPDSEKILILRLAKGKSLNSFPDAEAPLKAEALKRALSRWLEVALFETGFFNGDLHAGNIFAEGSTKESLQVTLLDFGNVHRLSLNQRRGFVALALGVLRESPAEIAGALSEVCELDLRERSLLEAELKTVDMKGHSLQSNLNEVFATAVNLRIRVPSSLLMFERGLLFFIEEMRETNLALDRIDPARKLERVDPTKVLLSTVVKTTLLDQVPKMFKRNGEIESTITKKMLKSIVFTGIQRVYQAISDKCQLLFFNRSSNPGTRNSSTPGL